MSCGTVEIVDHGVQKVRFGIDIVDG